MKTKLRASVFREAARLVGQCELDHGCNALNLAVTGKTHAPNVPETLFFEKVLMPKWAFSSLGWYDSGLMANEEDPPYSPRTARILGLLLCELLVKEGWV